MNTTRQIRVVGEDGLAGTITDQIQGDDGVTYALIAFDSGERLRVPTTLLQTRADNTIFVALHRADLQQVAQADVQEQVTIPIIAEALEIGKRTVETGRVRVRKVVHEHDEIVDEPLLREEVHIERVAINQRIDALPSVRREGDTIIIPVVEEVLVVEKRLVLKEELHVTRRQTTERDPQTVTLRNEEIIVERLSSAKEGDTHRE